MDFPQIFSTSLGLDRKKGPITSIHVFDFDGTLVRTPNPVDGKRKYIEITGEKWKGGWWGNAESLSPPVLNFPVPEDLVVRTVFNEMEEVITRSETAVGVVATGRLTKLRSAVTRVLDDICTATGNDTVPQGKSFLHHDAIFTKPGGRDSTLEFKVKLFRRLVTQKPLADCPLKEIHIWEDREEHANIFAAEFSEAMKRERDINTIVHLITADMP